MMGHADIQTTMRYVHYVPQHNAADQLRASSAGQLAVTLEAQRRHRPRDRSPFQDRFPHILSRLLAPPP